MRKVEQEIFKAIQTIAKRLVDTAGYNRTITGTVTATPINEEVFYTVKHENALYRARYSGQEEVKVGDVVSVLIPNNDASNTKYILGKV